jgi:hypothetical protein
MIRAKSPRRSRFARALLVAALACGAPLPKAAAQCAM